VAIGKHPLAIRLLDPIDSEKKRKLGKLSGRHLTRLLPTDGGRGSPFRVRREGPRRGRKECGKNLRDNHWLVLEVDSISVGGKLYGIEADPYRRQG